MQRYVMSNPLQSPAPIAEYEATLRPLLNPANAVEEHFFHEIAVNTVLAGFLEIGRASCRERV